MDRLFYFNALRIAERAGVTEGFRGVGRYTVVAKQPFFVRANRMDLPGAGRKRERPVGDRRADGLIRGSYEDARSAITWFGALGLVVAFPPEKRAKGWGTELVQIQVVKIKT